MAEVEVRLFSQEGRDAENRLQSHQWAEIPAVLSGPFMSGGLKKIRRMAETYFSYRFTPDGTRVRGVWRSGEPSLRRQFHRLPFLHGRTLVSLGRLRSSGTLDVYRGYHEIRGGRAIAPAAVLARRPWPEDMPWVAPSAGEFTDSEQQKKAYLGIFEIRVERRGDGCTLHTALVDFPATDAGLEAGWLSQPWHPLRRDANLAFLKTQITAVARDLNCRVTFVEEDRSGTPARMSFKFDRHSATA